MCGIAGIVALSDEGKSSLKNIDGAVKELRKRGPDSKGTFTHKNLALGHARLKVIDTSKLANQPMSAKNGRYTIIYNGEFYNYKKHRSELIKEGIRFSSESDTEVLLRLYIREGPACLEKVNGFFALAIYDKKEEELDY